MRILASIATREYQHFEMLGQLKIRRLVRSVESQKVQLRGPDEDGKGRYIDLYV